MHRDRDRGFGGTVPVLGRLLSSSCMCAWGGWVLVGGAFEGRIWQPSPHQICSLSEATDRVRFSAVSTLSEFPAAPASLTLGQHFPSPCPALPTHHLYSPVLLTTITQVRSCTHTVHLRVDTTGAGDFLEPETLISSPRSRT